MVIVRFVSLRTAKNARIDPTSLPAYETVADDPMAGKLGAMPAT